MAGRKRTQGRQTIGAEDSLKLPSRGVGNEGGQMGETTRQAANADPAKSPLANDAGMEQMAQAVRSSKRTGKKAAGPRVHEEASPPARTMGRTTRKSTSPRGRSKMAPKPLADTLKGYDSSMTHDRESRRNPDQARGTGTRGGDSPQHGVSGSKGRTSGSRANYLKVDRGAGGADTVSD
jgi:hypothetical protein